MQQPLRRAHYSQKVGHTRASVHYARVQQACQDFISHHPLEIQYFS